jgi:DNA-binding transcriptional regulator GbsR (MarR family)
MDSATDNSSVIKESRPRLNAYPATLSEAQRSVIELAIRATQALGMPKSVGEIFGYIFSSSVPVSFENVVDDLGISNGSASHGLRYLRRLGAIKASYVARDRRDFYVAETSLQALANGFLAERVLIHLARSHMLLEDLGIKLAEGKDPHSRQLAEKVELLIGWHRQGRQAMQLLMSALL